MDVDGVVVVASVVVLLLSKDFSVVGSFADLLKLERQTH